MTLFFMKLNRLSPPEASSIVSFFFVSVFFILCFFYLDYGALTVGLHFHPPSLITASVGSSGLNLSLGKTQILEETGPMTMPFGSLLGQTQMAGSVEEISGDGCDVFDGNWVWDDNYPLYKSEDCLFIDGGFRCSESGRPDNFYTKWRWQPRNCNLPRFDAKTMLEKLRNRRLVFVGDSIGRNQWESLLCMLSSAVANKSSIFEVNGSPITKHSGFLVFKFRDFNCTVEYYRAPFLVAQGRPPPRVPKKVKSTLKLDQLDWSYMHWKGADVLVFNAGHWWNYEKTLRGGIYFQEGKHVKMDMNVETGFRRAIETLVNWVDKEVNLGKTQVLFRSYAPVHFSGGDWNTGGTCHLEMMPDLGYLPVLSEPELHLKIVLEVLKERLHKSRVKKLDLLNVTYLTSLRKDGHLSLYYQGPNMGPAPIHRQDCSHWCLPGVPDSWNELLYVLFLKWEYVHARN